MHELLADAPIPPPKLSAFSALRSRAFWLRLWLLGVHIYALPRCLLLLNLALQLLSALLSFGGTYALAALLGAATSGLPLAGPLCYGGACYAALGGALALVGASGELLGAALRQALTRRALEAFFSPRGRGGGGGGGVDTPDQRATADAQALAGAAGALLWGGFDGAQGALPYTVTSLAISAAFIAGFGSPAPVLFALAFAALGVGAATLIAAGVSRWAFLAARAMGRLRGAQARVGAHAEAVCLLRGQAVEGEALGALLRAYCAASLRGVAWAWAQSVSAGLQGSLPILLGYAAVLAVLVAPGGRASLLPSDGGANDDPGAVLSAERVALLAGVTTSITYTLCFFPALWAQVASLGGLLARVLEEAKGGGGFGGTGLEAVDAAADAGSGGDERAPLLQGGAPAGDGAPAAAHASAAAADAAAIAEAAQRLHAAAAGAPWELEVIGASGCGKSSALRALSCAMPLTALPCASRARFLPQRPYVPPGTLAQVVAAPAGAPWGGCPTAPEGAGACGPASPLQLQWLLRTMCGAAGVAPDASDALARSVGAATDSAAVARLWGCAALRADGVEGPPRRALADEGAVAAALEGVGLSHLCARAGGLHEPVDWEAGLSRGELARLALAAILLEAPPVAVLDEPYAALDAGAEAAARAALRERGISTVTVSHKGGRTDGGAPLSPLWGVLHLGAPQRAAAQAQPAVFVAAAVQAPAAAAAAATPPVPLAPQRSAAEAAAAAYAAPPPSPPPRASRSSWLRLLCTYGAPPLRALCARGAPPPPSAPVAPPAAAAALLVLSAALSVGSILLSLRVPAVTGAVFEAVLSGDARAAGGALGGALAWYALSPLLGATSRAVGEALSLRWFGEMTWALNALYLAPGGGRGAFEGDGGGWLTWRPPLPLPPPLLALQHGALVDAWDQRIVGDAAALAGAGGPLLWGGSDGTLPLLQTAGTMAAASAAAGRLAGPAPVLATLAAAAVAAAATHALTGAVPPAAAAVECAEGLLRSTLLRAGARAGDARLAGALHGEERRAGAALVAAVSARVAATRAALPGRALASVAVQVAAVAAYAISALALGGAAAASPAALFELLLLLSTLGMYAASLPTLVARAGVAAGAGQRVFEALALLRQGAGAGRGAEGKGCAGAVEVVEEEEEEGWAAEGAGEAPVAAVDVLPPPGLVKEDPPASPSLCALQGPSGAGKTTFQRRLAGLLHNGADGAQLRVRLRGAAAAAASAPPLHVFFSPQRPYAPTFGGPVAAVLYPARDCFAPCGARREAARAALRDVGLPRLADEGVEDAVGALRTLSGGELQRLAVARVLVARPDVAVLDEPAAALDDDAAAALRALVARRCAVVELRTRF